MRRIILSICLCLYHVFTYAQVNFDEVYKAAKQGNAEAQAYLSWMYITGDGVSQNQTESFKWASKAANQGHAIGCYILGQLYINGQGTQINPIEGSKWMLKAAEKGNVDAFYTLGEIYFNGVGVKKDMTEGFKWFLKAAEQGNVNAQVQVGYMYSDGLGVEKNQEEAFRWTKMAAEVGDAVAQANLSWYYFKGLGTNVDYEESYYWAKKSADQNDELGYENLANCYLVGSRKNIQKAIECMDKAIELCQSSGRAKYDITYLLRMYNKKGNIYLDEKNFVKAEEMAKLIMDINPQYQDEEDNRLMVYTQTGKIVANKANFAQVKRAEPSSDMDVTIALSDWVIEPRYEYAAPFNEGLALVNEPGEKYGYIDVTGNYVVLPRFDTGRNYNNGMATVGIWSNGRLLWGFINKEGKYVVTPKYADAKDYNEGYIPVKDKMTNKWFFVDWYGGPWVGYQYEDANIFIDEKALVKVGKVNAYVNKKGIILCSEKYKEELYVKINREYKDKLKKKNRFICDLIPVKEGNKWGYKKVTLERYISANILPWDLYQSKYLPILESYENYLKSKIEANINKWQKKGEFEPTPKWEKRVNELTRKQKIDELTNIFKEEY